MTFGSHKKAQAGSPSNNDAEDEPTPLCAKPALLIEIAIANNVSARNETLPDEFKIAPSMKTCEIACKCEIRRAKPAKPNTSKSEDAGYTDRQSHQLVRRINVAVGSIATELGPLGHVRSAPASDRIRTSLVVRFVPRTENPSNQLTPRLALLARKARKSAGGLRKARHIIPPRRQRTTRP